MYKKVTFYRWLMALTLGIFLMSGALVNAQDGRNITGSFVDGLTAYYSPGISGFVLEFETTVVSPDSEWIVYAELDFPEGITVVSATDMNAGGARILPFNGESGEGALISFGALTDFGSNWLTNGNVAAFTVTVDIAADFAGDLTIDWMLHGDEWGADPHSVTGTVVFEEMPFPYPVDFVIATELSDEQVMLEWGFDASTFVPEVYPFNTDGMSQVEIEKNWNAFLSANNINTNGHTTANRSVVGYQVWRERAYLPGALELLGTTSQNQFIDFAWGTQDWGIYKWYIVALYEMNESEPTASNPLDKDMNTTVSVQVVTNSGDSPFGTTVQFTSTDPEPGLEYGTVLGADGSFTWDEFRRGTYDIEVFLPGYPEVMETGVDIFDAEAFEWLLIEILAPPTDLYVTPTGLATWVGGTSEGDVGFEPYFADFEANDGGWVSGAVSGADHWEWGTPASSMINFAYSGSNVWMTRLNGNYDNNANTYLMRQFDFSEAVNPVFSVQLFMRIETGWDALVLEYSLDDGNTWEKVVGDAGFYNSTSTSGPVAPPKWSGRFLDYQLFETTMPELAGQADVWLRFRFGSDSSVNDEGVAIDDVSIVDMPERGREFLSYKVFHSGILITETGMTEYQFGTNGEALVDGQTYLAEVAAVYTTGQSEKASYSWTYVACDNYPSPGNFTAEQVTGTLNIQLSWTIPTVDPGDDQIDFTRIYRNGIVLAEVEGAAYLDANLEFGNYEYCLTFVFESGAESCLQAACAAPVSITGNAFVNGTVTNFDGSGPIAGVEVMISNADNSFTFTTNAAGFYTGEVVAGTYDYYVSADGFTPETLNGVVIVYNNTVTNNFVLVEFPYPVGNVVAVDQGSSALIYWNKPGTSMAGGTVYEDFSGGMPSMIVLDNPAASWSVANDMLNLNTSGSNLWRSAYYNSEFDDFVFEVEMQRTSGATTGSMGIYVRGNGYMDLVAGNGLNALAFTITQGGSYWYGTMINGDLIDWSGWLTTGAINTGGPNVLSAVAQGTTVQFFVNGTLVHTVNNTTLTAGYCGVFSHEGTAPMTTVWDYWMIEPGAVARDFAVDQTAVESKGTVEESFVVRENSVTPQGIKFHTPKASNSRELNGYNVWRAPCYDPENLTFLGYTLDTTFVDNQFGTLASGVWSWAVEAVYTFNSAEPQYSNCLDVAMYTMVTVDVQTNSGQSPEETEVMFVNTSEPHLELVYEVELDASGAFTWDDFRKGTYNIMVEKSGFAPIYLEGVVINIPSTFNWVLQELLLPVEDLYVTPTGFATWRSGGDLPFEPYFQDFNEGLPETWTVVDGGTTADTWSWRTSYNGSTLDGTPFMFVDSDGAGIGPTLDEMLYSPVINAETAETLFLMFEQYYFHLGSQFGRVEVYNGSDWVTVLNQTATIGSWAASNFQTIDITDHINAELQVRFHFNDAGGWNWYWAVDNFAVVETLESAASRELLSYTVWLDGVVSGSTTNEYFQHNTDNLNEGQTYLSEVAAVYTTGMSAKMQYEWTFYGCENFPGPTDLTAVVENNSNVVLSWGGETPPPPPGGDWYELKYHNNVPADAYFQQYNYGYGVVYNLSGYSNVTVEKIDFRHSPWGINGTWNYKLHIVDWDTYTLIHTTPVLQSTLNNGWEIDIPVGSLPQSGLVGVFLEPMGNSPTDAYPCIDGDGLSTTSSFFGALPNWQGMSNAGVVGNFLMDLWILADPQSGPRQLIKAPMIEAGGNEVLASRNPVETNKVRQVIDLSTNPYHVPGGSPETANREDVVLNYDGENFDAIGLTAGGNFNVAARFPASMVGQYAGYKLSTVQVYINNVPSNANLKVWGSGTGNSPGALLHTQSFTSTASSWITITLSDDVELDGNDLWVGYDVTHPAGQFPAGCDAGPANPDGAWISIDGVAWDRLYELAPTLNYNWNIRATITDDNGGGGGGGIPEDVLGANIYRNGVLIAEMVQGDTYTDEDVLPGEYEYCVTFVYDLGAESCPGDPCVTVEVTCESPKNLTGEYVWNYNNNNPEFGALIAWEPSTAPVAEWLYYDDGINVDGIGGPAVFTWAIKFDPAQLADFEGASLTKIQIYNRLTSTDELRIYEGTNAATLLHTQALSGLPVEAWSEVNLTSPVLLDVSKQLWIAVYTTDGANFPAGCGAGQGQPNGDYITLDGVVWEHLTDYGLNYTWNLRGFVTTAAGATAALPMEKPMDAYSSGRTEVTISGKGTGPNNVLEMSSTRNLDVFNIYRRAGAGAYALLATIPYDAGASSYEYFDTDVNAGTGYFYQVTAEYSYGDILCESAPALALNNPDEDFVYILITSVDDLNKVETRIYPNPASNNLTIEASEMQHLTMVNILGQVVYETEVANLNKVNLNTSGIDAGMYIIRVVTAEGIITSRVNIVR